MRGIHIVGDELDTLPSMTVSKGSDGDVMPKIGGNW